MKRKILSVLLAGAMTFSLAACGGSGDSGSGDDAAAEGGAGEGENTLTVMAWDPAFNIPALEAAAADYKENVNEDFELEILEQAASEDVERAVTTAASAGDYSNLPDMVLFQDHYIQRYVSDYPDAWTALGDIDINWDDFAAEKLDYSTIDGEHYGVPVDNGTVVCTWDKFMEIGKAVYDKTGKALLCMNADGNDLPYMMMQAEGVSQFKDGKPYITENETLVEIVEKLVQMAKDGTLLMPNSWSDYTDKAIQGDQVAGVMNGNWIIPTIEKVDANSGKWEITTMPTLEGGEGYASNGGASLYITSNCANVDLAKDFLAKTFGSSTTTYDNALKDGGVISTYIPAGQTEVYQEGVEYFNNQPIYADIAEMGTHVQIIEQSDYHYSARNYVGTAIVNIINGADTMEALQEAEDQLNFEMGN